ncbi:MAG: right-handed parallel beta-helix repeat-containing protein [Gammaproteobacteria bacterium]|nr:right-handed parallel beta-helix repeat-containing protein [Gammaproteobacteria bacterium]
MVTIDGNIGPTGPAIEGTIRVFAGGARIQFLTVTGPARGILVSGGSSSARVNHVNLIQNDGVGLEVVGGAFVFLTDSTVSGNDSGIVVSWSVLHVDNNSHIMNNLDTGILALDGSHVTIANSEVSVHPGTGISVWNGSSALLNNATVSANANGIEMRAGSIRIGEGTAINGNLNHGIDANLHSSVQIENASIYNNNGSGIRLEFDSGLLAFDNVDIHSNSGDNIVCGDLESSAIFLGAAPSDVVCTDYN